MPLTYATNPGDIDHLIADDHAVVERQFQHLEAGRGDRRTLVDQVHHELALHATAEEKVLYPALAKVGMEHDSDEAVDEHQQMKEQLAVLDREDPGTPAFEQALSRLIGEVRHHVGEEEGQLLPEFRAKVGDARMAELGEEFLAAKRTAPTHAHPNAPASGLGHKVADLGAKVVDLVRDQASGRIQRLANDPSGLLVPQAQAISDAHASLEPQPFEILTPTQARLQPAMDRAVEQVMEDRGIEGPEAVGEVRDLRVPDAAGGEQRLRVYTPAGADTSGAQLRPVVFWIHGGGWVLFDVDTYDASCRGLANKTGAVVVTPDYRRAPEHVFPASHDDVLVAYRWAARNAATVGGDPTRIGIGGESVGGGMAVATCLALADAGEPLPAAQVLVYPLVTIEPYGDSMTDAADARPLDRPLVSWMAMHAFLGEPDAAHDPRVALLDLAADRLALLPPTLVITAERDPLRSQGQEFARRLEAAGVPTELLAVDGVMHEFFGAAAVLDQAEQAQQRAAEHFGGHLLNATPA